LIGLCLLFWVVSSFEAFFFVCWCVCSVPSSSFIGRSYTVKELIQ
jgi:hypothetical protein